MKSIAKIKKETREKRHRLIRSKLQGDSETPRISIFKSLKHTYAQLIDDKAGQTLATVKDADIAAGEAKKESVKDGEKELTGKVKIAYLVGKALAIKAVEKKIVKAVFDRGGYKYHGRVKALADGARAGGLKF